MYIYNNINRVHATCDFQAENIETFTEFDKQFKVNFVHKQSLQSNQNVAQLR